jgi:RpiR family carbohydrate utilization transcriptional regulator
MDRVRNLLEQIQGRLEELNKAERKVAEVILLNPQQATRFSIAARPGRLGQRTDGQPFLPFVRRQRLPRAQAATGAEPGQRRGVRQPRGGGRRPGGLHPEDLRQRHRLAGQRLPALDPNLISRAVDLLIQARQIHFFGLGASAPVALDAQHKFFRFNLAVTAHADVLMQRMIASVAHTGELFVIISYTGRTRELVEVARIARENGASVLGLTAENSPLAKAST